MFAPKSTRVAPTVIEREHEQEPFGRESSTLTDCDVRQAVMVVVAMMFDRPWDALASVNQVEQREQEDPDQVDDVPVQRGKVDRSGSSRV